MTIAAFDEQATQRFNAARDEYIRRVVPLLRRGRDLRTAVDVGCGFGYFTRTLLDLDFDVTAVDGREANVAETVRRNPAAKAATFNVEDAAIRSLGTFDLVVCLGLLYHLENPFAAIRNLSALTGQVVLIESVCAPQRSATAVLYEEDRDIDQGLDYIALIPSESWLVKVLYHCGFEHVYRAAEWPDHPYFRATATKRRRRTMLAAAHEPIEVAAFERVPEPRTRRHMWDRLGPLLESDRVRAIVKAGMGRR